MIDSTLMHEAEILRRFMHPVAITATDSDQVKSLHAKAIELGAQDEDAPGARGGKFYGAYIRDLDGNKLAVFVCLLDV